jgi:hypothetical protein
LASLAPSANGVRRGDTKEGLGVATQLAPFLALTPQGLLGLVVIMMLFGYLVPLRMVRGRLADKDAVITEQRQTIAALLKNNDQLLRGNTATVQVLDALPEVVGLPNDVV